MKPLADLRRAVATAACLAIAPAPFWPRIEREAIAAVRACNLGTAAQRARPIRSEAAARRACARFAAALRAVAPTLAAAEIERLRKTILLAEEAIKIACDHRSARHAPGETAEETAARWNEADQIETAAKAARKAARKALADLRVFPDLRSPEQIAESIAAAKAAALALKAACDAGQRDHARRQIRLAARDCAKAAAPAERHPLDGRLVISAEQAATMLRLLRDPAAYALVGWQEAMEEDRPEEIARWIADLDSSLRLLGSPDTFATLKRFHG